MQYDVTQELKMFDGNPIPVKVEGSAARNMTLRDVVKLVCLNAGPEQAKSGEDKMKLYEILDRTHNAETEAALSAEEVAQLKRVAGAILTVAMFGAFVRILEAPKA